MNSLAKLFLGTILLLVVIVSFGVFFLYTITSNTETLISYIEKLEEYTLSEDWANTDNELIRVNKAWEKAKTNWPIMVMHSEIVVVTLSLEKVKSFIKTRDRTLASAEIATLKEHILAIPEKEAFTIKNIL